jgi:transcriptional regulator with XRE-family HTH domain
MEKKFERSVGQSDRNEHLINKCIGQRIKYRRVSKGLSQENLGGKLGLSYQQVQKYENGSNRVSAARLYVVSKILDVTIQFFFFELQLLDDMEKHKEHNKTNFLKDERVALFVADILSNTEKVQLNKAFGDIKNPVARRCVVNLIKILASRKEGKTSTALE